MSNFVELVYKSVFLTFAMCYICLYSYGMQYPVVNAKGDGIHDDTRAIQTVIDSLSKTGGGIVYLESGTYLVSSIRLGVKTSIIGSGNGATIIKQKENCKENCLVVSPNSAALKISDLTILGTDRNVGIFFDNSTDNNGGNHSYLYSQNTSKAQAYKWINVDNVCVYHFATGVQLERWGWDVNISNSTISHNGNGVIMKCTDSSIYNCYIMNNSKNGLLLLGSNNKISNIKSIWNGIDNAKVSGAISIQGARNQLVNCETQDNYCSGFIVNGQYNHISNCVSNSDGYCNKMKQYDSSVRACGFKIMGLYNVFSNCVVTSYTEKYGAVFHSPIIIDESVSYYYTDILNGIKVLIDKDRLFFHEPLKNVQSLNSKNTIANIHIEGENGNKYFVSKLNHSNFIENVSCQSNSIQFLIDFRCSNEVGSIISIDGKTEMFLKVLNKRISLMVGTDLNEELLLDEDAVLNKDDMRLIVSFSYESGKRYLTMLCYEKTAKRGWIKKEIRKDITNKKMNIENGEMMLGDANVYIKRIAVTNVPLPESVFLPYSNTNHVYASSSIYVDADTAF